MSTLYGSNYKKAFVDFPPQKMGVGEHNGRVKVSYDEFDIAVEGSGVTPALNDVLKLSKIPAGARVIEACVAHDDLGATGTAKIGWEASESGDIAADDDGFLPSIDLNSAANVVLMSSEANVAGQFKKFNEEVQVSLTFTAACTAVTGKIKCAIYYILD